MFAPVEQITDELSGLVGWGANGMRCACLPGLRKLAGAEKASYHRAGVMVMDLIIQGLRSLDGSYDFYDHIISAHDLKWALRLLLGFEGKADSAPGRRFRAIRILGLHGHTPDRWRRKYSPQRDLLRILAEAIVSIAPNSSTEGLAA